MSRESGQIALLIDSQPSALRRVAMPLARAGWDLAHVPDLDQAMSYLNNSWGHPVALLIVGQVAGLRQPDAVRRLRRDFARLPLLLLAEKDRMAEALEGIGHGAHDLLDRGASPIRFVEAANQLSSAAQRPLTLGEKIVDNLSFDELVGAASDVRRAIAIAAKASRGRLPILIRGERGVGKDSLARAIHLAGQRAGAPFVKVSCRDLGPGLCESALFGHVAGAFPGAFTAQAGSLAQADSGTVLLDEIETLSPDTQHRLLDFLENGIVRPAGEPHGFAVETRLIAATDVDLADHVAQGLFREDLYCRLAMVSPILPPLRDRRDDIAPLARNMLDRLAHIVGIATLDIHEEALSLLTAQHWPGNVRQLQSTLLRAALACPEGQKRIAPDQLPQPTHYSRPAARDATPRPVTIPSGNLVRLFAGDGHLRPLEAIEADIIRLAIGHYHGRMSEAARRLGIGRSTLYRKLVELGISDVA